MSQISLTSADLRLILNEKGFKTESIYAPWFAPCYFTFEANEEVFLLGCVRFTEGVFYIESKRFFDEATEDEVKNALQGIDSLQVNHNDGSWGFRIPLDATSTEEYKDAIDKSISKLIGIMNTIDKKIPQDPLGFRNINEINPERQKQYFSHEVIASWSELRNIKV